MPACGGARSSSASAEHVAELYRTLGFGRAGITYEFVGVSPPSPNGVPLPLLGDLDALSGDPRRAPASTS